MRETRCWGADQCGSEPVGGVMAETLDHAAAVVADAVVEDPEAGVYRACAAGPQDYEIMRVPALLARAQVAEAAADSAGMICTRTLWSLVDGPGRWMRFWLRTSGLRGNGSIFRLGLDWRLRAGGCWGRGMITRGAVAAFDAAAAGTAGPGGYTAGRCSGRVRFSGGGDLCGSMRAGVAGRWRACTAGRGGSADAAGGGGGADGGSGAVQSGGGRGVVFVGEDCARSPDANLCEAGNSGPD